MPNDLLTAARRAEGSEILPGVMLGNYRADALILKLADALEAAEADAERLAMAASAERQFGQLIEDEIEIEPEETTFTVRAMPEGRSLTATTWAEVARETEAALAAHSARKENANG